MDWLVDKQATTWTKAQYLVMKTTLKDTSGWGTAVHWHLSTNFHLLCHDLTNCSTHCKHGSQPLRYKWGLHTPFQILRPMWNLSLKFLFIVALPHSLNLQYAPPPPAPKITGARKLRHWYLLTSHIQGTSAALGSKERFKPSDSVGIIMSCEEARNQSIRRHAPLWFSQGLRN